MQGGWAGARAPCSLPAQALTRQSVLLGKEAPSHLLSLPRPWLGSGCLEARRQGSKPGGPFQFCPQGRSPSDGPCLTQCRSSSPESQTCFFPLPSPVLPKQPSPRARFPEMKRKKKLMMSPRCFLQPWWHSCSLRAAPRAGPGVSPCPATPGPGPILGAPAPALGSA